MFSIESFMDELAQASLADPVEFRLETIMAWAKRAIEHTRSPPNACGPSEAAGGWEAFLLAFS